jgi:hypothetical protein
LLGFFQLISIFGELPAQTPENAKLAKASTAKTNFVLTVSSHLRLR